MKKQQEINQRNLESLSNVAMFGPQLPGTTASGTHSAKTNIGPMHTKKGLIVSEKRGSNVTAMSTNARASMGKRLQDYSDVVVQVSSAPRHSPVLCLPEEHGPARLVHPGCAPKELAREDHIAGSWAAQPVSHQALTHQRVLHARELP